VATQAKPRLFLLDNFSLTQTLLYQVILLDFGHYHTPPIRFDPLSLRELLLLAVEAECIRRGTSPSDADREEVAFELADLLLSKAELLQVSVSSVSVSSVV
jgi:DNA mismatch repair protein Mlh1 C-terminus